MTRRKKVLFLTVSITLFLIPVVLALSAQTRVKEPSKSLRKLKVQKIRATVKKGRKVKKKAVVKKGKYVFSKKRLSKKELQASKKRIASVKPEMRKAAEEIEKLRETAITQEDRERAANRLKTKTKNKSTAFVNPGPGDTPDYSGLTANWAFSPPLRKFVDSLPGLGPTKANNLGQYLSVAVPDTVTYPGSDYYEIELRQYTEKMHSDLQPITHRGYVQVNNGTDANGNNTIVPAPIRYLGPIIIVDKDRPVRIKFTNKLPTGQEGNLFLPVDDTVMGAGMGPLGINANPMNYTQNRATLHLHGGRTVWISDGTPHQWITPALENTSYPKGVSVSDVPDMPDPGGGSQTFYYSNQQSARFMFYHDHSLGITRLNVYAGEAAGYIIKDPTEKKLVDDGVIPSEQIPLVIQDKTFVDPDTIGTTDPTWNSGTTPPVPHKGDLWYPHVYMPAQNPYSIDGLNPMGRWHYGPWFWPPTKGIPYGPIPNPYYDPVNAPWQPPEIPGTPDPSAPGEAFMDTPVVNGNAFPFLQVQPKSYRFRVLNAADDRVWNLQLYKADPNTQSQDQRTNTEVKMVPAVPHSNDPNWPQDWPTDGRDGGVPDPATAGPEIIQIGTESGFMPKPVVLPNLPVGWNNDPTTFNFGNVDQGTLILGPAERADVVIDFSQYAGQTLILYNDAPAAYPARDPRLDYYTSAPDLTDTGGHSGPQVGFGPNTRTIMQIRVANTAPDPAFDQAKLESAFRSTATTQGAFAASQDPVLVPNANYESAYNKMFPADAYVRIQDNSMTFKTLTDSVLTLPLEPKAIQDEMGEAFDDYGRMEPKLGLELPFTQAGKQNFVLQSYIDPPTEVVKPEMIPMSPVTGDGTQIWKITHNGVDTHPVHFHAFDVQLINRVGWDGAIRPPDSNELGWKDTVRVSPLEDTIVALRPVVAKQPFGVPNSTRPLDPTMPIGSTAGFTNIDPTTGEPIVPPVMNQNFNFNWEYIWHCHILSHEEMEMMRPIVFQVDSVKPQAPYLTAKGVSGNPVDLTWTDGTPVNNPNTLGNRANEIGFRIERATFDANGQPGPYQLIGKALANKTSYTDNTTTAGLTYNYRVVAYNAVGDSISNVVRMLPSGPGSTSFSMGTSSTMTLPYGSTYVLRMNLNDAGGSPIPNKQVIVESSASSTGPWNAIATVTSATGTYQYSVSPVNNTYYRMRFNDDAQYTGSISPIVRVYPQVWLSGLNPSNLTVKRGQVFYFTGYLKPRHTGQIKIPCYRYENNRWVWKRTVMATLRDYRDYTMFRPGLSLTRSGRWRIRAYHQADTLHAETWSTSLWVTVVS